MKTKMSVALRMVKNFYKIDIWQNERNNLM